MSGQGTHPCPASAWDSRTACEEIDLSLLPLPVQVPDLTVGPVLLSESAVLAVAANHRLAQRSSVGIGEPADEMCCSYRTSPRTGSITISPLTPSSGLRLPITAVPGFQEILAYVTSGHGVDIVGAQN